MSEGRSPLMAMKKARGGLVDKIAEGEGRRDRDENSPRAQAIPRSAIERRETLGASVTVGATHRVHAPRVTADDDEPGAGEYGYPYVECWEADIGRTHLDRGTRRVARRTTSP